MLLTKGDIIKFQALYLKHFGIELSHQDAMKQGIQLITFVEIVSKTIEKERSV